MRSQSAWISLQVSPNWLLKTLCTDEISKYLNFLASDSKLTAKNPSYCWELKVPEFPCKCPKIYCSKSRVISSSNVTSRPWLAENKKHPLDLALSKIYNNRVHWIRGYYSTNITCHPALSPAVLDFCGFGLSRTSFSPDKPRKSRTPCIL